MQSELHNKTKQHLKIIFDIDHTCVVKVSRIVSHVAMSCHANWVSYDHQMMLLVTRSP